MRRLDAYEGHPLAYRRQVVRVHVQGRTLPAVTYVMTPDPDGQLFEGECLQVTMRYLLSNLNRLEGYPHFYDRRQLPVTLPNGKTRASRGSTSCGVFLSAPPPIPNGSWCRR